MAFINRDSVERNYPFDSRACFSTHYLNYYLPLLQFPSNLQSDCPIVYNQLFDFHSVFTPSVTMPAHLAQQDLSDKNNDILIQLKNWLLKAKFAKPDKTEFELCVDESLPEK